MYAIPKTVTIELCLVKVSSVRDSHVPDGITVCVSNNDLLLMGCVAWCSSLLFQQGQICLITFCTQVPQTEGKLHELLSKHPLCIY